MATTIPLITTIPSDPPSTDDPANFDTRADAFLGDFPDFATELNATATAMNTAGGEVEEAATDIAAAALVASDAAGYVGKMSGSLALGADTKAITLTSAKPNLAVANKQVAIVLDSDASIRMFGVIASSPTPTSTTFSVTVTSGGVFPSGGSGSFSGWKVIDAAFFAPAATAADIWAGTTDVAAITPKAQTDANVRQTLAFASTVTPDLSDGWYRYLEPTGPFTMGAPTNCKPGDVIKIDMVNTAGSVVMAVNGAWERDGGLAVIGPDDGDENRFIGFVEEVDGSGVMTKGIYDVVRTPG